MTNSGSGMSPDIYWIDLLEKLCFPANGADLSDVGLLLI